MAVLICVQTKANLCREMWRCLFLFLLVAFQIGSCAENSTEEACQSCQLADLTAKHKIYNWLVLSIVLLLLVLLLVVVGFLCYRMWPRDRSACERAVFRYNLAQDQQRVIISDISSSRTSPGEQDIQRIKAALACDTRLKSTKDTGVRQCVVQVSQENRRRKRAMKPSLRWKKHSSSMLFITSMFRSTRTPSQLNLLFLFHSATVHITETVVLITSLFVYKSTSSLGKRFLLESRKSKGGVLKDLSEGICGQLRDPRGETVSCSLEAMETRMYRYQVRTGTGIQTAKRNLNILLTQVKQFNLMTTNN